MLTDLSNGNSLIRHDVVWALVQSLESQFFTIDDIINLLENHAESSSLSEVNLMTLSASMLSYNHNWDSLISEIAISYADSRSRESNEVFKVAQKVPLAIRPAINHAVLRHSYSSKRKISSLGKRIIICKSMLTGYI